MIKAPVMVQDVGVYQTPSLSVFHPTCEGLEGKWVNIQPFVVNIPFSLWGRDLLQQWGLQLSISPFYEGPLL